MKKIAICFMIIALSVLSSCLNHQGNYDVNVDIDFENLSASTQSVDAAVELEVLESNFKLHVSILNDNILPNDINLIVNQKQIKKNQYHFGNQKIVYTFIATDFLSSESHTSTQVNFNLDGGKWSFDILDYIEASYIVDVAYVNNDINTEIYLYDQNESGLKWYYKAFLKQQMEGNLYQIVATDLYTANISQLTLPEYDEVIAIHFQSRFLIDNESMIEVFMKDAIGIWIKLEDMTENSLFKAYIFNNLDQDDAFIPVWNHPQNLPFAHKDDFEFAGWVKDDIIVDTFIPFKAKDGINKITYRAIWRGVDLEQLDAYLDTLILDTTHQDILLPALYSDYMLSWHSSHSHLISHTGGYSKNYFSDQIVTLSLLITNSEGDQHERTYQTKVKGMRTLNIGHITSSYIYREYNSVTDEAFKILDVMNLAFITADSNANLNGSNFLYNTETYIMPRAKQSGTWVILSVAPESSWSTIAASQELINKLAINIVEMINVYGFDGVDIDWETPRQNERTRFTQLMKTVYALVKENNPHHLVTTAITGGQWQPPMYDLENSNQYLDYINLMTYSMTSNGGSYQNPLYRATTFHHAAFDAGRTVSSASIDESITILNSYGITNGKIIVGVAFYGVRQVRTYQESTQTYTSWQSAGSVYYPMLQSTYLDNDDYELYYDERAGVPYIINNDGTVFISFDNPQSIQEKARYIMQRQLAGMMFWEYGTDTTGVLLAAMKEGFNR